MLFVRDYLNDRRVHRTEDASDNPLVSVILPTFNRYRSGLLKRSIDSVLAQTFEDFELIVMDDGSSDGTRDLIERYRESDSRVILVRHELHSGLPVLRMNEGITVARGRYVAFQFDDDTWRPHAMKLLTDAAQKSKDAAVIVGTAQFSWQGSIFRLPDKEVKLASVLPNSLDTKISMLIPRVFFDLYGMYDCHIAMRSFCDYDLLLRMIRYVPFVTLDEDLSDAHCGYAVGLERAVPIDYSLFRYLHEIPRNHLLTPDRWEDYEIDALRIGHVDLRGDRRRRLYEEQLVPYYLKMRHCLSAIEHIPARWDDEPMKNAVVIGSNCNKYNNYIFNIYDILSSRREFYKIHHEHPRWVTRESIRSDADAVMLVGLHDPQDESIAQFARGAGLPVAYFLDHDPFQGHQSRVQSAGNNASMFDYHSLARIVVEADAVWTSDASLERSVHAYNRRTIPYSGCVPPECLPDHPPGRERGLPVTIGYIGDDLGIEETGFLWDALGRISEEFGTAVNFEFWGVDLADLPRFNVPVRTRSLPSNSFEYLGRLRESRFDILLAPRLDLPRSRSGVAPPAYHSAAVACALGIFSDIPHNVSLIDGEACLLAANTSAGWLEAIRRAITMPTEDFDRLRSACIAHVREAFTSTALVDKYEAAWRATEFHQLTRDRRGRDGRPCVVYFLHSPYFAGAETQLWRRLRMVPTYGIAPVVVLPESFRYEEATHQVREELSPLGIQLAFAQYIIFTEPKTPQEYSCRIELDSVLSLLQDLNPALVHSTTFIPSVGQACQELGIPHIASLFQIDEKFVPPPGAHDFYRTHCDLVQCDSIRYARQWRDILGVEYYCARGPVPERFFDQGRLRTALPRTLPSDLGEHSPSRPTRVILLGALQPRKGQLAAITAVGALRREGIYSELGIYGHTHFYPDYLRTCEERIAEDQTQYTVTFHGFGRDVATALEGADILLCSSTDLAAESFPTSINEAMAAGVLVVTTPAGGVSELIVDGVSGILCRGFSNLDILEGLRRAIRLSADERNRIVAQARRTALVEFHPHRTASDLFSAYVKTIRNRRAFAPTRTPEMEHVPASTEPALAPDPVLGPGPSILAESVPQSAGRSPTRFSRLRRVVRRTDTLLLRLLDVYPPPGAIQGQTSAPANHPLAAGPEHRTSTGIAVPHSPHTMSGPHRLGLLYCRLRRFARRVDTVVRVARDQFRN